MKYFQAKKFCRDDSFSEETCNVEGMLTSYSAALALYEDGFIAPKGEEIIRVAGRWDTDLEEWADDVASADCKL